MFNPDFTLNRWYVNLEAPPAPWADGTLAGIDTSDHALDIVVTPDRRWRWKDEHEYLERAGHPDYWTVEQAGDIRAEGERVIRDIDAAAFPFDGSWCDFRPDPTWPLPALPRTGWDRPRAGQKRLSGNHDKRRARRLESGHQNGGPAAGRNRARVPRG